MKQRHLIYPNDLRYYFITKFTDIHDFYTILFSLGKLIYCINIIPNFKH